MLRKIPEGPELEPAWKGKGSRYGGNRLWNFELKLKKALMAEDGVCWCGKAYNNLAGKRGRAGRKAKTWSTRERQQAKRE